MKLFLIILGLASVAYGTDQDLEQLLNNGNNQFTARMFTEVVKANPGKSVVLSAFSVLTPLAQLSLASEGASHDELLRTIGLPDDNTTKAVFSLVNNKVRAVKGVDLKIASRVYIPHTFELNDNFQSVSRAVFGSEVENVDFTKSDETAQIINAWVEAQTNNRIKDLVDPKSLDATTRVVLTNAIYFKGNWENRFDKDSTSDADFYVTKAQTVKIPTMRRTGHYLFGESAELNAKLLRLPYEGGEASMLIILPNDVEGLNALEEKLRDPAALAKAIESMSKVEVSVAIPKFKIETKTNLKDVLKAIGVNRIFQGSEAKLSKLLKGEEDLFVSDAIQKAFIEVNEDGAEAAAANEFGISFTSFVITEQKEFHADHPFFFLLSEGMTALFEGVFIS